MKLELLNKTLEPDNALEGNIKLNDKFILTFEYWKGTSATGLSVYFKGDFINVLPELDGEDIEELEAAVGQLVEKELEKV